MTNRTVVARMAMLAGGLILAGGVAFAQMRHSMMPPDTSGLAPGVAIAAVEPPEDLSGVALVGERIFDAACARCHGENGAGRNGMGPPLVHRLYEPGHHGDAAIFAAVRNGVRAHHWNFGDMPPVRGLTRGDIKALTAYIRAVQRANGID